MGNATSFSTLDANCGYGQDELASMNATKPDSPLTTAYFALQEFHCDEEISGTFQLEMDVPLA